MEANSLVRSSALTYYKVLLEVTKSSFQENLMNGIKEDSKNESIIKNENPETELKENESVKLTDD